MKPRLLDLFCGAGGAAMGYHRAGFEVVGVDIEPQPHYPFEFHQADALTFPLGGFDVIHASPPCQAYSAGSNCRPGLAASYPDLVGPVRHRLRSMGLPFVIENVPGAPMRADYVLCGCMFGLRVPKGELHRPRWFEVEPTLPLVLVSPHVKQGPSIPVYGHNPGRDYYRRYGGVSIAERRAVMGIDWMNRDELSEAIPPAYTEWIGQQLMAHLEVAA